MFRHLPPVVLAALLAGCSMAPPYVAPAAPVPESWPVGDAYLQQSESALPVVKYTDVFRDPRLLSLAEQAIANNRDLRIAAANIAAARASARVARAGQLPQFNATGSADFSEGGVGNGQSFSVLGNMPAFELDLFGRLANTTAAARDRALATEAAARAVRITLVSDLAAAWSNYAADQELLAVARDTAENARRSLELTRVRLQGGIAPRTDVRQAEQILATAEADLAVQTTALAQDENLVRLLVGADFDRALLPRSLAEVTASIATLPAGTSSQVLLRRPDIIEAEYRLRATHADIGAARARLFPTISLTGLLGFTSDALGSLFSGDQFRASGGASASQPLFDGGARGAGVDLTEAQRDAALATYERAIQTAFRQVADALAVQGTIAERLRTAQVNSEAAADTARLTEARYRGGIDSFLANLDAQRSLYTARRREVEIDLAAVNNRVALYRALGTAPEGE
ncbi:efflux transporter outer membrane subunit [Altererythrobacter xixiisoli]|uniref:Efflux transporter outer membrane subunit n=2 Tax=Croceibacterium xixiisoli TaxID=1476466 RepID=A0A6I4TSN3_9SPHN|nr:efflux transporter outer membrane subunit [Croceibacterium xixiisoli]